MPSRVPAFRRRTALVTATPDTVTPGQSPLRPGPRRRAARRRRRFLLRRIGLAVLAVVVVLGVVSAPSLYGVLSAPGTDTVPARLAEWARTHGLGFVITTAEKVQYRLHPPQAGGPGPSSLPVAPGSTATRPPATPPPTVAAPDPALLPLPPAMQTAATQPLPGEGTWHVVQQVRGMPAIATAYVRADPRYPRYLSGVAWMNPKLLTFQLHPGYLDPGQGNWGQPNSLAGGNRSGLLAAFNAGFRMYEAQGGYFSYGHTAVPLRVGAASVVIYTDGSATVGQWGRDVGPGPNIAAVRQNLSLIVDNGQPVPGLLSDRGATWGKTIGNQYFVWRSGLGVRADGSLVYAAGNALSVHSLAVLLQRAGAVRALELDINPDWTSYVLYAPGSAPGQRVPNKLLPDMQAPAYRYDSPSSRDFFAVYAR